MEKLVPNNLITSGEVISAERGKHIVNVRTPTMMTCVGILHGWLRGPTAGVPWAIFGPLLQDGVLRNQHVEIT